MRKGITQIDRRRVLGRIEPGQTWVLGRGGVGLEAVLPEDMPVRVVGVYQGSPPPGLCASRWGAMVDTLLPTGLRGLPRRVFLDWTAFERAVMVER